NTRQVTTVMMVPAWITCWMTSAQTDAAGSVGAVIQACSRVTATAAPSGPIGAVAEVSRKTASTGTSCPGATSMMRRTAPMRLHTAIPMPATTKTPRLTASGADRAGDFSGVLMRSSLSIIVVIDYQ